MKSLFAAVLLAGLALAGAAALACPFSSTSAQSTPITTAQSGAGQAPHSTPAPASGDGG